MRLLGAVLIVSGPATPTRPVHTSALGPAASARDSACAGDPSWTARQEPIRIYGNTWHVGPQGLGVFLITSPGGHVLIDGGLAGNTSLIEANIRSLGINLRDIKWILNSHAHCDHAGGIAELARATGAQVIASAADTLSLARGGRDDPQYGDRFLFPAVRVTRTVADGENLRLGTLVLTAHATPGHTRGNTTWTWQSCEGTRCLGLVLIGSLSAPDYKLVDNPRYPGIVNDYARGFAMLAALPCEIALAPHPGMVDFWERVARRDKGDADALVNPALCRAYAGDARAGFEEELTRQTGAAAGTGQRP